MSLTRQSPEANCNCNRSPSSIATISFCLCSCSPFSVKRFSRIAEVSASTIRLNIRLDPTTRCFSADAGAWERSGKLTRPAPIAVMLFAPCISSISFSASAMWRSTLERLDATVSCLASAPVASSSLPKVTRLPSSISNWRPSASRAMTLRPNRVAIPAFR